MPPAAPTATTPRPKSPSCARMLGGEDDKLPPGIARYVLRLTPSERDKRRMHDLAVRNQDDALSPAEKQELFAYVKIGSIMAILKAKAGRYSESSPPNTRRRNVRGCHPEATGLAAQRRCCEYCRAKVELAPFSPISPRF